MSLCTRVESMSDTRKLDHGTPPERFARGWHCLGLADSFRDGKPHAIEAFGGKLVVWADSQGKLNVLDGYCRHMGGDLTQGTVKGDEIACPFHDWRWGGDGKCKQIPYARRVPLRARTQKYPVVIRNGQLMIWHDIEGSEPDLDILPPVLPGVGDRRLHRLDVGGRRRSPTRTAARSSTTSWTWRTSSTSTSRSRPASATSSRARRRPSSWSRRAGPTWAAAATATPTWCSSPRRRTSGRRT